MLRKFLVFIICLSLPFCLCSNLFALDISARAAVLINADSGEILYALNEDCRLPMASTTKIMTAIVVLENCNIENKVLISGNMTGAEGSSMYLKSGEELTYKDLLYGLMLSSANDAAEALAISVAGSVEKFASLMNDKAFQLGLENTNFTNPHGLDDEEHYTTAYELGLITAYCLRNSIFAEIVSTRSYTVPETSLSPARVLVNHNRLLSAYEGCTGVKTGFTKRCGRCLVTAANAKENTLIAVTLNCYDDWNAHKTMLDYGFSLYEEITIADEGDLRFEFPVLCGISSTVTVSNKDSCKRYLSSNRSEIKCVTESIGARFKCAPVKEGDHLADALFYENDKIIARIPLYAEYSVDPVQ